MTRVPLLGPQDVAAEHRGFLEGVDARGGLINVYRAMAHSPVALRRFFELVACLWAGELSDRVREIAILSVVSASQADYPLGWHILDGEEAGLTPAEVRAIIAGDHARALPPDEAAIATYARELTIEARASDETFGAIAELMDEQQIVELTMLIGMYRMVACVATGLAVDLDEAPARALEQMRGTNA